MALQPKAKRNYSFQSHIYINVNQFIFDIQQFLLQRLRYPYFYKGQDMNMSPLLYPLSHSVSIHTSIQKDVTFILFYSNCLFLCLYSDDFRVLSSSSSSRSHFTCINAHIHLTEMQHTHIYTRAFFLIITQYIHD